MVKTVKSKKLYYDESLSFPKRLKAIRQFRKMSKADLASAIGKKIGQINRYESENSDKQYPPLSVFIELCVILQVDPKVLLGIKVKRNKRKKYIIDNWDLFGNNTMHWNCPKCDKVNSDYGSFVSTDYDKNEKLEEIINYNAFKDLYVCEYCGCTFEEIQGVSKC